MFIYFITLFVFFYSKKPLGLKWQIYIFSGIGFEIILHRYIYSTVIKLYVNKMTSYKTLWLHLTVNLLWCGMFVLSVVANIIVF